MRHSGKSEVVTVSREAHMSPRWLMTSELMGLCVCFQLPRLKIKDYKETQRRVRRAGAIHLKRNTDKCILCAGIATADICILVVDVYKGSVVFCRSLVVAWII